MTTLIYIGICVLAYGLAIPLRPLSDRLAWLGGLQNLTILLLVTTMGLSIGSNQEVVANIGSYGLYALAFTLVNLGLSLVFAGGARRALGIDREGRVPSKKGAGLVQELKTETRGDQASSLSIDPFTLVLGLCVVGA